MDWPTLYTSTQYLEQNPAWHREDSLWKANKILQMLQCQKLHVDSIVEVGCGAGDILVHLQRILPSTVTFVGYDISPHAIELCHPKRNERLSFEVKDFVNEEMPRCDLLLAIDVLEHIPDYLTFLRKLRTKATYKLFHIPLDLAAFELVFIHSLLRKRDQVGHLHYFTRETALATLRDSGYQVLCDFYTPWMLELPQKSLRYRMSRIPFKLVALVNRDLSVRIFGGHSLLVLAR